jgi:hypothetical protein
LFDDVHGDARTAALPVCEGPQDMTLKIINEALAATAPTAR